MSTSISTFILVFLFFSVNIINAQDVNFSCDNVLDATIWCDDFESNIPLNQKYFESGNNGGDFVVMDGIGTDGSKGVRVIWQKGEVGAGGFKKSFGRAPGSYISRYSVNPDSNYKEIYWRMDVKHQKGWQGNGPDKLSRALVMANNNWATGMMAHIWTSGKYLGIDPASGISENGKLVSTKYNDFDNLRWWGWKGGDIDMFSTESSGKWFCVVGHARLNDPGESNGIFEFWINDSLQAGYYNLNWHGNYNENPNNMMINAIFFENYWNSGSPVEQGRYFDNIVISTKMIDCNYTITGVEEKNNITNELLISPNPTNGLLKIDFSKKNYTISIINNLGIEVLNTSNKEIIDIRSQSKGVYFIRVQSGDKFHIQKIIKY